MSSEPSLEICDLIGRNGKYQSAVIIVTFFASALNGFMAVIVELYAPQVNLHWDWDTSNATIFSSTNCQMNNVIKYNVTSAFSNSSSKLVYESPYSKRTLTEQLNLICERSWLVSSANTMLLFGTFLGFIVNSRLSEIYGRKLFILGNATLCVLSNVCILFCQNYIMFLISITVYGATAPTWMTFLFLDVMEILPKSLASYIGCLGKLGLLCGQTLLVGVAWILQDWFYTQLFQAVFVFTTLLMSLYILESPLWLSVRRKYKEAEDTITKIIVRNGLDQVAAKPRIERFLTEIKNRCEISSKAEKGKVKDLFKNRVISFYTIAMTVCRSCLLAIYNGVVMNTESFGSGMYYDLMISGVISIVSVGVTIALLKKISIRQHLIAYFLMEGIVCSIYPVIYEYTIARSVITVLARWFVSCVYCVNIVYISQVFPTSVRGIATGFVNVFSSLTACGIPFSKEMGENTVLYVPFIMFSALSFMAAVLYKFTPETKGKEFVHTVDELLARNNERNRSVYVLSTKL